MRVRVPPVTRPSNPPTNYCSPYHLTIVVPFRCFFSLPIVDSNCAHMHCDVDLRSRRMWAASYRLTRLIMNEDSHVPRGPDTGRERVQTQRRGNGDDGAGGGCARARALMLLRPLRLVGGLGWVSRGGA